MSRELEPLKALENIKNSFANVSYGARGVFIDNECGIIEKELKEYEELKKEFEMEHTLRIRFENILYENNEVLRIIEEKGLSTNELHFIKKGKSWEEYIKIMKEIYFDDVCAVKTKEEYDLLKRYLWKN